MNTTTQQKMYDALARAIGLAGGQKAFARLCGGHVRQGHVYNWLHRNKKKALPCEYVLKIEKALNKQITRYEFRPDIYPPEEF